MLTLSLIALSLVLIYVYVRIKLNYWAKLEVPHMKPEFLIGNLRGFQTKYKLSTLIQTIYEQKKGTAPVIGLYIFLSPVVIVSDLDFLKNVFVKDFEYFSDRGLFINERDDPLSANLFSLPYTKWKALRSKFSATFQASRLKAMYPLFNTVATELRDHLKSEILRSGEIDVTETFNQYTITLILQTVYGLESKCLGHPENIFCKMGPAIMQRRAIDVINDLVMIIAPNLAKKLRLKFNREELRHFFTGLARDTVQYREMNNVMRNDFMALLMQLRKSRTLHGEDKAVSDGGGAELLTDDELAAQAFIFFFGGFETSSKTLSYILYELALNSNIQERSREEVQQMFQGNGHTFSYESLQKMTYLDQIINETLRKYPVIDTTFRRVQKDYQIPNTSIVLRKGQTVIVPIYAIHRDKDIYPDPEVFDPDRFTKENVATRHPFSWIPFGSGPRICIGARYANFQIKIAMAFILNEFRFIPCARTDLKMDFKLNRQFLDPKRNIWLRFESI